MFGRLDLWEALMHTRRRREQHEEYVERLEAESKTKHFAETSAFNRKQNSPNDRRNPHAWHRSYPNPDIAERRFTQWYAKYAVSRYRIVFNGDECLPLEFGYRGKYTPVGRCFQAFEDAEEPPADEDDQGVQVDEVHR